MGNVRNKGRKSTRKVLTLEEAKKKREKKREESRNHRHSIDEQILPILAQQVKQNNSIENAMLDTPEQESKRRNLIVDNTIHSPLTHISISVHWMGHYTSHPIQAPQILGQKQRYLT